ncbi:hypothetical protein MYAM1_003135 [Malassezia yamatoensis]|uniref:Uncharacterized protein n=1 Tax=Malassezia yamatoensis TaxID=253288 RepID=A0AAJ5YVT8_9BASI|nr:hypothetical protein MYAM1_003135 [Malassezia yamatoensis]
MEYVEKEMQKRGLGSEHDTHEAIQLRIQDPKDVLFSVAEKYRRLQKEAQQAHCDQSKRSTSEEATSTLGAAMLSKVPEVDLGLSARLQNIEATEKAKRKMFELRQSQTENNEKQDDTYSGRIPYFRQVPGAPRDRDRSVPKPGVSLLREARLEAQGIPIHAHPSRSHQRQERASDARVLTEFRKRQRR